MKTIKKILLYNATWVLLLTKLSAQVIETNPLYPTINDAVDVTFHVDLCNCNLEGYTGDIYAHTGVLTTESVNTGDWKHVKTTWGENTASTKLDKINTNTYLLHITPDIADYYNIDIADTVSQLAFVFRSSDATKQTSNIFYDVYEPGLNLVLRKPQGDTVVKQNDTISISAETVSIGTSDPDSIALYIDDSVVFISKNTTLDYNLIVDSIGKHWIKVVAANSEYFSYDSIFYFVRDEVPVAELPTGVYDGINYVDTATVTLVLFAPYKDNVFLIGDFNDWELDNSYLMNRTSDEDRYWITLQNLEKDKEYTFQYLVDGNLRIADPYADKILDPMNDKDIPAATYPNLKEYPVAKTSEIASVLQPGQTPYTWEVPDFTPANSSNLLIYELLVRDFTAAGNFKTLMDSLDYLENLGINAIELMPVNEFEGNDSWGYNPSFYFAVDKAYGTKNDYKKFIDECHKRGISVIQDIVLNHSYGQSPMVRLYFESNSGENGQPSAESPWFNQECLHQPWCWGYDFNHESEATKTFVFRVTRYWLEEYKIDGFRFDFTKGFTNKIGDGWAYDASRIAILKEMVDSIKSVNENAIVIFEHLSDNSEETALANYGILLWGKMTDKYNEATMGYHESDKSNFIGISYQYRGWESPHLVGYMESHDEQRLMYKNITYGKVTDTYSTHDINTSLHRIEAVASFFFTVPGPKMIWQFGELGYDINIDEPCRVCRKPILWEYYSDPYRKRLNKVFSALMKLRTEEDLFETTDFDLSVAAPVKKMHLNSTGMNATIIGNFDVVGSSIIPAFQHTGTWYDFFSGTTINVSDVNTPINLLPGEYHIYTDIQLEAPDISPSNKEEIFPDINSDVIFPNPSDGIINMLSMPSGIMIFELFDLTGNILFKSIENVQPNQRLTINLNRNSQNLTLFKGMYVYKIISSHNTFEGKLLIE